MEGKGRDTRKGMKGNVRDKSKGRGRGRKGGARADRRERTSE